MWPVVAQSIQFAMAHTDFGLSRGSALAFRILWGNYIYRILWV